VITPAKAAQPSPRSSAMGFVLLIGVVSLFADMTHEGARSVTGPFLAALGASALVVSVVAGFGELLGYALRFAFGYAADRTGRYWPIMLVGYSIQMAAVPMLALADHWQVAAMLIVGERTGRAMRNPARDAMLAHATEELGRGRVFGVREALDAAGGMVGPLLVALVLYVHGGYRHAFAVLAIPAVLTLVVLVIAWRRYPEPAQLETAAPPTEARGIPRVFWIFLAGMGLVAVGYADFPLIALHLSTGNQIETTWIPVLYAAAMASEAIASLVLGKAFDRFGTGTVVIATVATAAFAPLVFLGNAAFIVLGVVVWGFGMAAQESIVKATVTGMVSPRRRATAFGLFDTGFGVCWFAGSVALGVLYETSVTMLVAFSAVAQLAALPFLVSTARRTRSVRMAP
jgi:MFS family permease